MAKDTDKTVPVYDPQGNLVMYTTQTGADNAAWEGAGYSYGTPEGATTGGMPNFDQSAKTGTDVAAGTTTYYDPDSGSYKTVPYEGGFEYKDDYEWTMVDGARTYTKKSDTPSKTVPVGDNNFDKVYEGTPGYEDIQIPWDQPDYDPWVGRDPNTGGVIRYPVGEAPDRGGQGYDPIDLTPGYSPPQEPNAPTNSEIGWEVPGRDQFNIIERDPLDPVTGFPIRPEDRLIGGGSSGVDAPTGVAPPTSGAIQKFGYEGYGPNKDFYQQQFADMRMRDASERAAAYAASLRAGPQEQEAVDPWGWVEGGLPTVYEAGANSDFDPNAMVLNQGYGLEGGMTNRQIIDRMSGIFDKDEMETLKRHMTNAPNFGSSQFLGSGYENVADNWAPNSGAGFGAVMAKLLRNTYMPAGDVATPGGQMVPVGYASPTNS